MASKKDNPMLDPIAYREDYPEESIIGTEQANESFSAYGDDSDLAHQQQSLGWMNDKYGWEWVGVVNYNEDATLSNLPNYIYWKEANQTWIEWYLSKRNDNVASALFNEWKLTKEDVVNYLAQQQWWNNSSEMDRMNTVESIWKRIGNLQGNGEQKEEAVDTSRMEQDLNKDTSWTIYGKTTAEEWNPKEWIDTLEDKNSVFQMMNNARITAVEEMISMWVDSLAAMQYSWTNPYNETNWRDFRKYYPDMAAQVDQKVKELNWQAAINAITKWDTNYTDNEIASKEKSAESSKTAMAETYANSKEEAESIKQDINNAMASNPSAVTAEDTMASITDEINKLNTRLRNLKTEASKLFKWDVPDYIVNAYISNRTQEINDRLTELKNDYNAAYQRNQNEIDNYWKERSYWLQERQIKLQEDKFEYEKQQTDSKNNVVEKDWTFYEVQYTDNWVVIKQLDVQKQYAWSWMNGKWLKNNNPWNIKDTTFGNVIWTDDGWFAIFATPEDWFDALVEKIKFNQTNPKSKYYWTTIRQYFQIYAPKEDWNDPEWYAQSVARALWVSVDTPISKLDATKFAAQIAKHDSGYNYSTYWQFRTWSNQTYNDDLSGIEVPDDVYIKDTWYSLERVDPNSEEWKALAQAYREQKATELWYSSNGSWWYLIPDSDWKNTAAYRIISSDWETPLVFRQRLYNLVPTQLKNSDKELQNLYDIAKDIYKAWYSADEASMIFYWVDPREDKTWMLKNLIYKARMAEKLPDSFYWDLWWLLDAWELDQAVAKVETSILPEKYIDNETTAISIIKKIDRLREKLKEADKVVWPFQWTIEDFKNQYVDWWWTYQQVASDIVQIYSQIRKELMWSNITETELSANKDMFPQMTDKLKTIKVKLQSLENSLIDDINWYRDVYKLPELTKNSLLNQSLRKYHYWYNAWGGNVNNSSYLWDDFS